MPSENTMTDQIREQVSALLDGELPHDEMGLLVRRLERDPELRRSFGSYALIGEALRAPGAPLASPAFASRVAAVIDAPADAVVETPAAPRVRGRSWRRPVAASAIAASAALAAIMLVRPVSPPAVAELGGHQFQPAAPVPSVPASPTPAQSQRLASYMVAHSQFSTPMVRRNVWSSLLAADPGITRVSYDSGEAN
jgi:sigma-E factor negative regulatory protein RseA